MATARTLDGLPTLVLAQVLRAAHITGIVVVAHVCHTLHDSILGTRPCRCHHARPKAPDDTFRVKGHRARSFWAHWRATSRPSSVDPRYCIGHWYSGVSLQLALPITDWRYTTNTTQYRHDYLGGLLYRACRTGDVWCAQYFMHVAKVDVAHNGYVALEGAVRFGQSAIVHLLLGWVRVRCRGDERKAILLAVATALEHHRPQVIDHIIPHLCSCTETVRHDVLVRVAARGHVALVEKMVRMARAKPAKERCAALTVASRNGHVRVVDCLLRALRPDASANRTAALVEACRNGHVAVVERLLADPHVRVNEPCGMPLRLACGEGHGGVVALLLARLDLDPMRHCPKRCPRPHRYAPLAQTAFGCAVHTRNIDVLQQLVADERVLDALAKCGV